MDWFTSFGTWLSGVFETILSVLPDSPFQTLASNSAVGEVLGYVNYFIPINSFVSILELWLTAVAIYYVWQVILRWIRAIQ